MIFWVLILWPPTPNSTDLSDFVALRCKWTEFCFHFPVVICPIFLQKITGLFLDLNLTFLRISYLSINLD